MANTYLGCYGDTSVTHVYVLRAINIVASDLSAAVML